MSGIMQQLEEYRKMSNKRGSTNNNKRLAAFSKTSSSEGADWGGCDPELFQQVVQLITGLGGAMTVGLSRDLGSYMLTLMLDKEKEVLWFNGNANLDEELTNVIDTLKAMG